MTRVSRLQHRFVEYVPDKLEAGVIYVTVNYSTAVHLCCCGCGHEVVTPISPTDWMLIFDGETISLKPSIGNWSFPCRSHYWIRRNAIEWAEAWSHARVDAARRHDRAAKDRLFADPPTTTTNEELPDETQVAGQLGLWRRILQWFTSVWRR